jgi:hypothetical protein
LFPRHIAEYIAWGNEGCAGDRFQLDTGKLDKLVHERKKKIGWKNYSDAIIKAPQKLVY